MHRQSNLASRKPPRRGEIRVSHAHYRQAHRYSLRRVPASTASSLQTLVTLASRVPRIPTKMRRQLPFPHHGNPKRSPCAIHAAHPLFLVLLTTPPRAGMRQNPCMRAIRPFLFPLRSESLKYAARASSQRSQPRLWNLHQHMVPLDSTELICTDPPKPGPSPRYLG